ncbi:MAG: ComF family protein [Deltaproteobacteria bacterium]|nr:MAG: ComF family protein [Deltaproteobacteria bacterium]
MLPPPRSLQSWTQWAVALCFPPSCPGCREPIAHYPQSASGEDASLCPVCLKTLFRLWTPLCKICSHPTLGQEIYCSTCVRHRPLFDRAFSAFVYVGIVQQMLHRYKYRNDRVAGKTLEQWMAKSSQSLEINWWEYEAVVPVPLHPKRLRERGFNQSVRLILTIPNLTQSQLQLHWLQRVKATQHQYTLNYQERQQNLRRAFQVHEKAKHLIRGKRVLLVDDVLTSGATAEACAYHLLQAGAKKVDVLTLCRAVL